MIKLPKGKCEKCKHCEYISNIGEIKCRIYHFHLRQCKPKYCSYFEAIKKDKDERR
jgi:hypothetical protein